MPEIITKKEINSYEKSLENTKKKKFDYNEKCLSGEFNLLYRANEKLLNPDEDLEISQDSIKLKDYPDIEI